MQLLWIVSSIAFVMSLSGSSYAQPAAAPVAVHAAQATLVESASDHSGSAKHADTGSHGGHHGPGKVNWIYGFIGTDDGAEPSLLYRKSDMPPPFLANLINFAIFAAVVYRFGRKPLQDALKDRKQTIMKEIDAATKMRDEAAKRLAEYEDKLQHIDDEIERIREDFRAQGVREKERILAEAQERKERMLRDAQFMIDQEVRQMRIVLMREAIDVALDAAERLLQSRATAADHDRIAEDYVKRLASGLTITKGGSA